MVGFAWNKTNIWLSAGLLFILALLQSLFQTERNISIYSSRVYFSFYTFI